MRFVCGRCRAGRIATQGLTDNDRSDAFARALARLPALVRSTLPARSSRQALSVADRGRGAAESGVAGA
jgi:hypothetical protein